MMAVSVFITVVYWALLVYHSICYRIDRMDSYCLKDHICDSHGSALNILDFAIKSCVNMISWL